MLTPGRTPQFERTPLFAAARSGHRAVVEALVEAGANTDAPDEVRDVRGGEVGRTNGVCVSFWGLQKGC